MLILLKPQKATDLQLEKCPMNFQNLGQIISILSRRKNKTTKQKKCNNSIYSKTFHNQIIKRT